MAPTTTPFRILLVEDNPIDVRATLRAANKLKISSSIDVVIDGDEAIRYLESGDHRRPDLILLDLNLPGLDGHDVLSRIKGDVSLKRIPVVVLTTSANDADLVGAYDLGANAYVNKPTDLSGWQAVIEQIEKFWFSVVRLPPT